jgi:hypothetical protein
MTAPLDVQGRIYSHLDPGRTPLLLPSASPLHSFAASNSVRFETTAALLRPRCQKQSWPTRPGRVKPEVTKPCPYAQLRCIDTSAAPVLSGVATKDLKHRQGGKMLLIIDDDPTAKHVPHRQHGSAMKTMGGWIAAAKPRRSLVMIAFSLEEATKRRPAWNTPHVPSSSYMLNISCFTNPARLSSSQLLASRGVAGVCQLREQGLRFCLHCFAAYLNLAPAFFFPSAEKSMCSSRFTPTMSRRLMVIMALDLP